MSRNICSFRLHWKAAAKRISCDLEDLHMQEDYRELSKEELSQALKKLSNWKLVNGKLHRSFEFGDFSEAFAFMTRVAIEAEKLNHHPEWSNVYNHVTINLATHDIGNKISNYDVNLAQKISEIRENSSTRRVD
jgi:4a-hydroxytetrahydrobiopterin dehydratase